jgi:hypothetical protein
MDELRDKKLQELREQVRRGQYVVDPSAVAEAIMWRVWGVDVAPKPTPAHMITRTGRGGAGAGRAGDDRSQALVAVGG